ncbi:DUF397 domain-containing protein [Haloglycomyces albus]|uniref:DUF397 domain-containing protein n=1 Tax=Haloglycomyces albus TaxID=526067 RepID=UPI0004B9AA95|nr:DUF397 domain-containing protein [Haloglycomyces albus]
MLTSEWKKSARSGHNGACVEVRVADKSIQVKDSKLNESPILRGGAADWQAILSS